MLRVGTAGYSYADWVGAFYPQGTKQADFLPYYSTAFKAVEVDFTYYRQPSAKIMEGMVGKVPKDFRFTVKAHKTITHEIPRYASSIDREIETFAEGIAPMVHSGTLGCVLYQFPWGFGYSRENLSYVVSLKDKLPLAPSVVEFRNSQWARPDVYKALRDSGTGFCCVDEPNLRGLFPRISMVTSDIGYLRFHGRNAAKWWSHKEAWERYDYLYTDDELKQWISKIAEMDEASSETYVLFNNCHRGQAATNAVTMKRLLELARDSGE